MRWFFLSFLVGLLPAVALAQACPANSPTTNLTLSPGSLSLLPAIDQGGTGLCYAFTVSQLVDARRFTNPANRGRRISPLPVGMLTPQATNFLKKSRLDDGGSVKGALDTLMRSGNPVCSHAHVSRLYGDTDDQFTIFGTMEIFFKQIREAYYTPCNCATANRRQKALGSINEMRIFMTTPSLLEQNPSEGMNNFLADLATIIIKMNDLPPQAFANYNDSFNSQLLVPYFNRLCRGQTVSVPKLKLSGIRRNNQDLTSGLAPVSPSTQLKRFSDHAWDLLAQGGAQPVGVNFCSSMLTGSSTFVSPDIGGNQCGNHAAVLAGKRCRAGRRQFLLRNSWGDDCGQNLASRHRANCDGRGNVWVDAESLMKSAYSLYQTVP